MDWNQLSDDDSWNDISHGSAEDNKKQPSIKQEEAQKKQNNQEHIKNQPKNNQNTQSKSQQPPPPRQNWQQKKFPTEEEMIAQYQANKIEDSRRLNVLKCFEEEEQNMLDNMLQEKKIFKLRSNNPGFYVVTFRNRDDLVDFIKDKIQKKYRFKVGYYVQSQRQKEWRLQREKERTEQRAKQDEQRKKHQEHRDHRDHHRDHKQQKYKQKEEEEEEEEEVKQHKKPKQQPSKGYRGQKQDIRQQKQQKIQEKKDHKHENKDNRDNKKSDQRDHKKQLSNEKDRQQNIRKPDDDRNDKKKKQTRNVLRVNERKEDINVLSDEGNPLQVVEWIKNSKFTKQFSSFNLHAAGNLFSYMEKLSNVIYNELKFGLVSQINEEDCQKQPNQVFKYIFTQNKTPVKLSKNDGVYITKVKQECFQNVQKLNNHIIGNKNSIKQSVQFDQKEYIQLFKKNYSKIVQKWDNWIIIAYSSNIGKLLRVSGAIKKLLPKNKFNYEVGCKDGIPMARFQIFELSRTKFKVDTSVINSHLKNA